jgi:hypothetical protein
MAGITSTHAQLCLTIHAPLIGLGRISPGQVVSRKWWKFEEAA